MNRTYVTLEEFCKELILDLSWNDCWESLEQAIPYSKSGTPKITFYCKLVAEQAQLTPSTAQQSDEVNKLFCTYIYPKYKDMCVAYYDDNDLLEKAKNMKSFFRLLNSRILQSYDEYKKLIDTYESIKNNLMDSIKSKSQSKFNDTPQTVSSTYDDTYNTSVTTSNGETEGATKIARLKEIEDNITDFYEMWCNKVCKGVFIYE